MARSTRNNNPPANNQSWLDTLLSKINGIGGAILVLFSVGGGCYQVGRLFMENEKNVEMYDIKISNREKIDSLKKKIEECEGGKSNKKTLKHGKYR